jgi:uncharacterized protein YjbI with pentapeptide repeats
VNPEAKTTPTDVAALQNEMRKTYLQVVGGAFALFALYLTFRRVKVAEQGHITDRYTKAIEQLGALTAANKPNVEVRLGAIYALERIAFDSPRDHWTIMEVLTAYVRQNAPAPTEETTKQENKIAIEKKTATEIQAILTVLGRRRRDRKREGNGQQLDLSNSDLCEANFLGAHLDGASFYETQLDGAYFSSAHLDGAWFYKTHTDGANFFQAHLDRARFDQAQLEGAYFYQAHLDGAWFYKAHSDGANFSYGYLQGTSFVFAHLDRANFNSAYLESAEFSAAHLDGVVFFGAHLDGAVFEQSHLAGADFRGALDLKVGQFANSVGVEQALFDDAFRSELEAAKEAIIEDAEGNDDTPQDTHPTEK